MASEHTFNKKDSPIKGLVDYRWQKGKWFLLGLFILIFISMGLSFYGSYKIDQYEKEHAHIVKVYNAGYSWNGLNQLTNYKDITIDYEPVCPLDPETRFENTGDAIVQFYYNINTGQLLCEHIIDVDYGRIIWNIGLYMFVGIFLYIIIGIFIIYKRNPDMNINGVDYAPAASGAVRYVVYEGDFYRVGYGEHVSELSNEQVENIVADVVSNKNLHNGSVLGNEFIILRVQSVKKIKRNESADVAYTKAVRVNPFGATAPTLSGRSWSHTMAILREWDNYQELINKLENI